MKRKIIVAVALLTISTPAFASAKAEVFGIGNSSCATALTTSKQFEARAWVMGFWSGLNAYANAEGKTANVGSSTDSLGMVGEIELYCSRYPSENLSQAAFTVYARMRRQGR